MPAIAAIDNETLDHVMMNVDGGTRTLAGPLSAIISCEVIRPRSQLFICFQ